ncbi:MAG: glycosyltransferase [Planctomycetota bacterium]
MRIARVMTRMNLGGPARQALASDPRLVADGHLVRLFTGEPEPGEGDLFDEYAGVPGLEAVRIPGLKRGIAPWADLRASRALVRELGAFAPDVVHTHASKAGALGRRATARLPGADGIARVHTFHGHVLEGYFPEVVTRRLIALERKLARDCDRIVAVSHATAEDLLRLGVTREERLVVVPPGVELEALLRAEPVRDGALRAELGLGPDAFLVALLGRLAEVKRPEWGLDVLELLQQRYPELHVVWIGDGDLFGLLERRIRAAPALGERAHLVGARAGMASLLPELDAVLLTSRQEGLPVALIEAAAAGLPVVATDVGGVGELVAHERTGFLGSTVDELGYGLAQLLDDRTEARSMGRRARLRVAQRYDADALFRRLAALYDLVLAERRGAPTQP